MLAYRAGPWKEWWDKDLRTLACLAAYSGYLNGVMLLWELDGNLDLRHIETPADYRVQLAELARDWISDKRIKKNTKQAQALCYYCPFQVECDAFDVHLGQTDDWPQSKRKP